MMVEEDPLVLKHEVQRALLEVKAVEFGDFTLASGKKSDVYVNLKRALTLPRVLALCARAMAPHMEGADRVAGVALGAVPLAVAISLETGLPYVMVRKEPKGHGTRSQIEGELREGDRVVLVEDVTTTAGSAVKGIEALRAAGAVVDALVVVVDRCEGAEENVARAGARLIPILTLTELRGSR